MKDLAIALEDRPGALAEMGEALGRAGVSIEGGGVFAGHAHFLFRDGEAAQRALEAAGIAVLRQNDVVMLKLRQGEAGQLGKLARRMAAAGVNIEVQYSDHEHDLVLVVYDFDAARAVAREWTDDGRGA